ncbi:hypothetical protein H8M03_12495 [Sphingomonas sabuli]|uniref:Uncharacterized protein n=1 Tax=Sphingomonas sabuli TaxID=2764186 RepID=A0A7G9L2D4_9SPHN|nr:hypothetical protein [Sphingomonas sabuli]QNM82783.1 hypothetical protein H8M03_12495 [Sphingomonas sabuli]
MNVRFILAVLASAAASVPAAAAQWYQASTPHFLIYSDQRPRDLESFAARLEKFDGAVRAVRDMPDPPVGNSGKVTIFFLDDADDVARLAADKSSTTVGFYIPRASGSVAFVPKRTAGRDDMADVVFFHEYAHHLMLQNSDAPFPPWFVEGFAEFFSTAEITKDGSVQLGRPANHRVVGLFNLQKPPIEELLGATFKQRTVEDEERFYSRGWALTHFLAFDPARKGQVTKYVHGIMNGQEPLAAARAAFGDLAQLDRELDRYLRRNRFDYVTVSGAPVAVDQPVMRPLTPGQAAMMPAMIRSARGVDSKTAQQVLIMARKAGSGFASDPAVQVALAEAEIDAGNYAEAAAAAERAIAADPNSYLGYMYRARAEMERDVAGKPRDWTGIRNALLKANKIDPEAAEPLRLFYESFPRAGQAPTRNAIDGMLYAQVLAPQDPGLRLSAVFLLIQEEKLAEARKLLGPIAYSPHGGSMRDKARLAMTALAANNGKAALDALD